jgi:glutamyl-tRNA synthetase
MLEEILPHVQERAKVLTEVPEQVRFLLSDITYDETSWDKVMRKEGAEVAVTAAVEALRGVGEWSIDAVEAALRSMLETHELSARKGLQPLRVAITGSSISPPLFESIAALGRDRTLERLHAAAAKLDEAG